MTLSLTQPTWLHKMLTSQKRLLRDIRFVHRLLVSNYRKVIRSIFGILILGFIIALCLPPHGYNKQSPIESLKIGATKTQMEVLSNFVVTLYKMGFPKDIKELAEHEVFLESLKRERHRIHQIFIDAWGENFVYSRMGQNDSVLISKGADRILGTSDDMMLHISLN